jgi:hypothetical protein
MNKKEPLICPLCGAKHVEYRFGFNKGLAAFLTKLYIANRPVKTDSLGLTYAQRTNSQKLRYWGLAVPYKNEESVVKRGWWVITQLGIDFVTGKAKIPKYAVTRSNEVIRMEGEEISFTSVLDGYDYYQDYVEQIKNQGV